MRLLPFLLSSILLVGCLGTTSKHSPAADRFMGIFTAAIDRACRQGLPVTVPLGEVDSFYLLQGSQVSQSGAEQIHSLSGDKLESLSGNRMELQPGNPVLVFLIVDGQEINGSMQGPPCPVAVPAISHRGSQLRIELLPSITALVMASYNGNLPGIRTFLDHKIDINGQAQVTPLIAAADGERSAAVTLLLEKGANPNIRAQFNGQTALHFAARKGNLGIVILLLNGGAEPNPVDPSGHTPLWAAAFQNHPQVIRALVKNGANLNHRDSNGNTAISIAAAGGSDEAIIELAALGLNPDQPNRFGRTPLFDAVEHQKIGAVQELLKLGANPNQRTVSGNTPMQAARGRGNPEIIRLLQEAGAK